ncbi:MAG: MarR family transcriptional regulator [Waltera sp.]
MNQTLTRKQFDILSILAEEKVLYPETAGEKSGHSLGTVNRVMQELTELQYVTEERSQVPESPHWALPCKARHLYCSWIRSRLVPLPNAETTGACAWTAYY